MCYPTLLPHYPLLIVYVVTFEVKMEKPDKITQALIDEANRQLRVRSEQLKEARARGGNYKRECERQKRRWKKR